MDLDLHDLCDAVSDEESFVAFLDVLRSEMTARAECAPVSPDHLAAAVAWSRANPADLDAQQHAPGGTAGAPATSNPWRRAARILFAGYVDWINET